MNFEEKVKFFARAINALGGGMSLYFVAPLHCNGCECQCFDTGPLQVEEYPYGSTKAPLNMDFPWYADWEEK